MQFKVSYTQNIENTYVFTPSSDGLDEEEATMPMPMLSLAKQHTERRVSPITKTLPHFMP